MRMGTRVPPALLAAALFFARPDGAGAYIDQVEIIHPEYFTLAMLWTGNVSIAQVRVQRVDAVLGLHREDGRA